MTPPPAEKPQEVPHAEPVRDEDTTPTPDSSTPCICTSFKVGHVSNFAVSSLVLNGFFHAEGRSSPSVYADPWRVELEGRESG